VYGELESEMVDLTVALAIHKTDRYGLFFLAPQQGHDYFEAAINQEKI
jgi:hypothetical protein